MHDAIIHLNDVVSIQKCKQQIKRSVRLKAERSKERYGQAVPHHRNLIGRRADEIHGLVRDRILHLESPPWRKRDFIDEIRDVSLHRDS